MPVALLPATRPRLPRGVRLRRDASRGWLLLAPETVFEANHSAAEILALCDGQHTLAEVVDALAARHGGNRARIREDAERLIGALHQKRLLDL